uniref:Uncharacterized protein n=1 Tax=Glossina palpalis gambiensis TaxID=67801 RepID=A0A1B0AY38_9MUSC
MENYRFTDLTWINCMDLLMLCNKKRMRYRKNEVHYNRGLMDNNGRKNGIKLIGLPPKVSYKK